MSDRLVSPTPRHHHRLGQRLGVSALALSLALGPVVTASAQTVQDAQTVETVTTTRPTHTGISVVAPGSNDNQARLRTSAAVDRLGSGGRRVRASLRDLQIQHSLRLRGVQGEVGIPFGSRADEVLTSGNLVLDFGYSPHMLPDLSSLTVMVNDEVIRSIPLPRSGADRTRVEVPIDPALIVPGQNRLNLRLIGHYTRDCEDPLHSSLWANVSHVRTYLDMNFQRLGLAPDLQTFPAPFYDPYDVAPLRLPFVFGTAPANGDLEAAAALASAFGSMAGDRGFAFPTSFGQLPAGDAIVFMTPDRMVPGLERPISGPTAQMIRHPNDPYATLLLVMGRDANELKQAATGLAYAQGSLKGESVDLSGSTAPVYGPNQAPRWLPTDRKVPLGEIAEAKALTGMGLQPGNLPAPFRVAPDLFFWPAEGGKLKAEYQYPRGEWLDRARSRLDVTLNGQYIRSLPLQDRTWFERLTGKQETASAEASAKMTLPAYALFGENLLGFNYDLQISDPGECVGQLPNNVLTSIKTTSYVDFRGGYHAARMPNLALFTGGGFPFTRMADLGQTAVLVSAQPTVGEVEGFLNLMGQFGDATGAATTGLQVTRSLQASRLKDKDILVIGKADLAQNRELFGKAPLRMTNNRLEVVRQSALERFFGWFSPQKKDDAREVSQAVSAANGFEGVASFRSPYDADRHVVAVLASQPEALPQLTQLLPSADAKAQIRGDLILKTGSEFKAYQIQSTHWRGDLPWWLAIGYWFSQRPLVLALAALLSAALIGFPLYYSLKAHGRRRLKGDQHD